MNRHVFKICVASGLVWLVGAGVVQAQVISTWTNNNTVTVLADHVTVTNATLLNDSDDETTRTTLSTTDIWTLSDSRSTDRYFYFHAEAEEGYELALELLSLVAWNNGQGARAGDLAYSINGAGFDANGDPLNGGVAVVSIGSNGGAARTSPAQLDMTDEHGNPLIATRVDFRLYFYDASSMDDPRLFIRDGTSGQLAAMMLYGSTGLIPEPGSLILLVAGSAMMLVRRRKMT